VNYMKELENETSLWPHVTVHSHRFGGREFLFYKAEIGHVHRGGTLDIPFPRSVRDALIADGLAEEHRWVPNSGWVSSHIRSSQDFEHALWLMRLSYLRYALKAVPDARDLLERETSKLQLNSTYHNLLQRFISARYSAAGAGEAAPVAGAMPIAPRVLGDLIAERKNEPGSDEVRSLARKNAEF